MIFLLEAISRYPLYLFIFCLINHAKKRGTRTNNKKDVVSIVAKLVC